MRKRTALILASAGVGLIVFSLLLTAPASFFSQEQLNFNSTSNSSIRIQVTGYDNGSPVSVPFIRNAPFLVHGISIDEIHIVVNWSATGSNVLWNTFRTNGSIRVTTQGSVNQVPITPYTTTWTSNLPNSSYVCILKLGTDICRAADIQTINNVGGQGWNLAFTVAATAAVSNTLGQYVSRGAPPLQGSVLVTYDSTFGFTTHW